MGMGEYEKRLLANSGKSRSYNNVHQWVLKVTRMVMSWSCAKSDFQGSLTDNRPLRNRTVGGVGGRSGK
ncbi:hypothetical protein QS62_10390 [Gallibacterium salpingitidis]|uniref:Uncharacterized protein n=1 Tax=Gallibacterium salpingitidis TaxID=505341 RepID=A0A1A7NQ71_9PAST|nr:hypothetical protein QS62_10390 [Gallibacterium salpingitidis]